MIGWACLADGDGTRAGMNPMRIPKWTRQRRSAQAQTASRGIESSTAPVWYLFRTAFRVTTRNTLRSAAPVFFLAMGVSTTAARISSRRTTHSTCGGGFILRFDFSTLTIPATTGTGERESCRAGGYTWGSKSLYLETSWERGRNLLT